MFFKDTVYSKFRTNDFTQIAIDALPLLGDQRGMIAFFIEFRGLLENLIGAEFNAKPAAFTTVFYNMKFPDRNGMGTGIQRQSPEFHPLLLKMIHKNLSFTISGGELSTGFYSPF
jgi:hypothetical protein